MLPFNLLADVGRSENCSPMVPPHVSILDGYLARRKFLDRKIMGLKWANYRFLLERTLVAEKSVRL